MRPRLDASTDEQENSAPTTKFFKSSSLKQPIYLTHKQGGQSALAVRRCADAANAFVAERCCQPQPTSRMTTMSTARRRFKVYYGPESETTPATIAAHKPAAQTVTVPLGEVLPLLADAVNSRRTWLADFANDDITISTDLYEVILAYQHHIRPSA
jgi:hypothetical protein